jgi:hypothetical protein
MKNISLYNSSYVLLNFQILVDLNKKNKME